MQQAKQVQTGLQCATESGIVQTTTKIAATDDWTVLISFWICLFIKGNVPTREAIHIYYQEQMMKSSRESGMDTIICEDEGQTSAERQRKEEGDEEEEEVASLDIDKEEAGHHTAEDEVGSDHPEHCEPELDLVSGPDGQEDPQPGLGSAEEMLGVPSSAESKTVDYPESSVAKTSQRWRPRLSRMDRVKSSSSLSSSSDVRLSQTHRWVLLKLRQTEGQTEA